MRAAAAEQTFQDFYAALLAKGLKSPMARLTLARKIAAITLIIWKKGVRFDAEHLKSQALERLVENPAIPGFHLWR